MSGEFTLRVKIKLGGPLVEVLTRVLLLGKLEVMLLLLLLLLLFARLFSSTLLLAYGL